MENDGLLNVKTWPLPLLIIFASVAMGLFGAQQGNQVLPGATSGGSAFPVTVSGTVNSGGIPCFTSATNEASSAAITAGDIIQGGGAGACAADSNVAVSNVVLLVSGSAQTLQPSANVVGLIVKGNAGGADPLDIQTSAGAAMMSFKPGQVSIAQVNGGLAAFTYANQNNGHLLYSSTAPTISSGFGTTPSIVTTNGSASFTVNVGTGGTASTGVIGLPTATTGWTCTVLPNGAPQAAGVTYSAPTSTSSVTLTNYTQSTGIALAWASATVLNVSCWAY